MPSTGTRGRKLRLWGRMLAACALLAVVAGALVGAEALFFGVISYGALAVLAPLAELFAPSPAAALVLAVVAFALVVFVVLSAYRAARESPRGFDVAPDLLAYASALLVIASLVVTYWVIDALGLPLWVFVVVLVTLLATVYPMALYQAARDWSSEDEDGPPPWAIQEREDDSDASTRSENLRIVAAQMRASLADVVELLGPAGTALVGAAAVGGLAVVYVETAARSPSALYVPLAVAMSALVTGVHVVDLVRSELTDAAVLRELDGRFDDGFDEGDRKGDRTTLQNRLDRLAAQAGVPAPDLRVVPSLAPTAAAVGYLPSTSTVVVSRGVVDALDDRELDAVLAHELAHVANRDAAVLTALSFPRVNAHRAFDRYGMNPVMALFAGFVAATSRFCVAVVARAREYAADDGAVAITGDPAALASALETLDERAVSRPGRDLRETSAAAFSIVPPPWEEHPFFDRTRRLVYRGLLGTHPPTEARIERLRATERDLERD